MADCHYCGGEIEFRYVDGRIIPIHVDGTSCSSGGVGSGYGGWAFSFDTSSSYVDPNAYCPVCGASVFFYQSPNGGRVFFDDLGWPWPKHPCTDNSLSQSREVRRRPQQRYSTLRNKDGIILEVFKLAQLDNKDGNITLKFRKISSVSPTVFHTYVTWDFLAEMGINTNDLERAPSFVVTTGEFDRIIEFICVRRKCIARIVVPRG